MNERPSRSTVHPARAGRAANVVSIASGKGGVGKTWLAVSLAHALAQAGQRTLLFDGDLGLANVDIQLGLNVSRDLGGVMAGEFDLAGAVTRYEEGDFDIVAGKSGSGALADLSAARLKALRQDLSRLATSYDRVIVDIGAGIDRTIRGVIPRGGAIVVVATDEPTALTDAYAFIKVAHRREPGADLRILINMAQDIEHGRRTYEILLKACGNFLRISPPLAGIVRSDDRVRAAIRRQTAYLTRYPATRTAKDLQMVAEGL